VKSNKKSKQIKNESLKFKIVESSGECESFLILNDINLDSNNKMIQSECRDGFIRI